MPYIIAPPSYSLIVLPDERQTVSLSRQCQSSLKQRLPTTFDFVTEASCQANVSGHSKNFGNLTSSGLKS